ncbi:MAG: YheU family protein [Parahaliea sp.]
MTSLIEIPIAQLASETLTALLEEFASRDGTDYGLREISLKEKVEQLGYSLRSGQMKLLYDSDSEHWDLLDQEQAQNLLAQQCQ